MVKKITNTPAIRGIGDNSAPTATLEDAKRESVQAFNLFDQGAKMQGSATQMLARAIMEWHVAAVDSGTKLAPLGNVLKSKEAMASMWEVALPFFLTVIDRPGSKGGPARSDQAGTMFKQYTARAQLLRRALSLASVLASKNVNFNSFADGAFLVPRSLLLDKGETAIGKLGGLSLVPLDGTYYMVATADDKFGDFYASVVRINALHMPKKERATKGSQSQDKSDADKKPDANALDNLGIDQYLTRAEKVICGEDGGVPPMLDLDSMTKAGRNALANLAQAYFAALERQGQAKPDTAKATKAPAKAEKAPAA